MKRYVCLIGLAATLALCLVPMAAGAETDVYKFQDKIAYASFQTNDGCIYTSAEVTLFEFRAKLPPGPPEETGPAMTVYLYRYDYCQNLTLNEINKLVELAPGSFSLNSGLHSARLSTTIEAYDWGTGNTVPVTVDVTWEGVGEGLSDSTHGTWSTPTQRVVWRFGGSIRDAVATGTVLMDTMNVSPGPSAFAYMGLAKSGEIHIYRR